MFYFSCTNFSIVINLTCKTMLFYHLIVNMMTILEGNESINNHIFDELDIKLNYPNFLIDI
jgi:hypothetical protein